MSWFKKKKTLSELETERDIMLYSLDFMLQYNIINIDEYNRLLMGVTMFASDANLKEY